MNFLEGGRLARAGSSAYVHESVLGPEHKLARTGLFLVELAGSNTPGIPSQAAAGANAAVDAIDHLAFTLKAGGRCDLTAAPENLPRELPQRESSGQFFVIDPPAAMPEGFSQNVVIAAY